MGTRARWGGSAPFLGAARPPHNTGARVYVQEGSIRSDTFSVGVCARWAREHSSVSAPSPESICRAALVVLFWAPWGLAVVGAVGWGFGERPVLEGTSGEDWFRGALPVQIRRSVTVALQHAKRCQTRLVLQ